MQKKTMMILGGYGVFGQKIASRLSREPDIDIIIAGRNLAEATMFADTIQAKAISLSLPDDLDQKLKTLRPDIIINCCGPFQDNDYATPMICIENGVHYVDIADGRDYVTGFSSLTVLAQKNNVIAVTGASTVPAISSTVIDEFLAKNFSEIHTLDYGINPGNQTPRGVATVASILSYVGKPISTLIDNKMQTVYGWQDLHCERYPLVGNRWMSNCDIPDLVLFKTAYPSLQTIRFYAGLELPVLHLGLWIMSWLVRWRLVNNYKNYASLLRKISLLFYPLGTQDGGMHMTVTGLDKTGQSLTKKWYILAANGHGPFIPAIPAVILAKKIARNEVNKVGAGACIGYITLDDIADALKDLSITMITT